MHTVRKETWQSPWISGISIRSAAAGHPVVLCVESEEELRLIEQLVDHTPYNPESYSPLKWYDTNIPSTAMRCQRVRA